VAAQDQGPTTANGAEVGLGEDTHLNGSNKLVNSEGINRHGNLMRCYTIYTLLLADSQQKIQNLRSLIIDETAVQSLNHHH
jgi:hypothetical protein